MQRLERSASTIANGRRLALAASFVLHLLFAAVIASHERHAPPLPDRPRVMQIAIVALPTTSSGTVTLTPTSSGTVTLTNPIVAPTVAESNPGEAQPIEPAAETSSGTVTPVNPGPGEALQIEAAEHAPGDSDTVSLVDVSEPQPDEQAEGARLAETGMPTAAPTPQPPPPPRETASMGERERALVERQVRSWAESFAALGAWQPERSWQDRGQSYTATMQPMPAAADTGIDQAIVTVTMTRDGRQYSTELGMQRLGFAHFAQFIDRWDPRVQIHDDRIDGRFHSNSEIYIDNSRGVQPVFLGEVTTARDINTSRSERSVRKSEVFLGGFETRVRRITMPKPSERFDEDFAADEGQVIRLAGDTQLHFRPDATVSLQSIGTHSTRSIAMSRNEPHYFIGTDDANISVRGIVDGQVLIYTSADIVIEGDLTYVDDPGKNPMSDDFLGLVSDRSIAIAGPEVTGSGDLIVQAALYARRQFVVKNHFTRQNATLHVYGSITAGSLSATEPRFRTKLEFDQRLAYRRPPAFPVTDRYEIVDWDGEWTVTAD